MFYSTAIIIEPQERDS